MNDEKIIEQARKVFSYYQFGGLRGTAEALIALGDLGVMLGEVDPLSNNEGEE